MKFSQSNGKFEFQFNEKDFEIALGCLVEAWRVIDEETFLFFFEQPVIRHDILFQLLIEARNKNTSFELTLNDVSMIYKSIFISMAEIQNWEFVILVGASKQEAFDFANEIEVPLLEMMKNEVNN